MTTSTQEVPSRARAGIFDLRVSSGETHGVSPSPDAIGGFYGIGWQEYYQDAETGEMFSVHCSDGVDGGNGPYSEEDEALRSAYHDAIETRCHEEADSGAKEIRISKNERALMQGFTHVRWLESADGLCDGEQSGFGTEGGFVGNCHGVPIICDLSAKDQPPPC